MYAQERTTDDDVPTSPKPTDEETDAKEQPSDTAVDGAAPVEEMSPSKPCETDQAADLERLRTAFVELKREVDDMKASSEQDIPISLRGIGLRILKDRIDRIVEEGEIGRLQSCLVKVQVALNEERRRSFHLEQQLTLRDRHDDAVDATRERMIYLEEQWKEWKNKYDKSETELEIATDRLRQKEADLISVRTSLEEAHTSITSLRSERQQAEEENAERLSNLQTVLDQERSDKASALNKIDHLERVISKLTEDASSVAEASPHTASLPAKQIVAFPDPPSEEASPKTQEVPTQPVVEIPPKQSMEEAVDQPTDDRSTEADEQQKWKWNVSGLWGYVTGE